MSALRIIMLSLAIFAAAALLGALGPGLSGASPDEPGAPKDADAPTAPRGDHAGPLLRTHPVRLTEEQEQQMLDMIKQSWPERYARLMELKRSDPGRFSMFLRVHWGLFQRWKDSPPEVQKAWVELTDTKAEIGRTLREYHEASEEKKPELKAALRVLLGRQLEAEHTIYRHRLAALEKQIAELRAELQHLRSQFEQLMS